MILDMATRNMDPVSRTIMKSTLGADLLDLDMAGGGAGGSNPINLINLQRQQQQYLQQQRQQKLLQQQRQLKLRQLQLLKQQEELKQRQRDAANMILAATAVGRAVEKQNKVVPTSTITSASNPYTTATVNNRDKDGVHISLYITSPSAPLQQAAMARLNQMRAGQRAPVQRPVVKNPATNMMNSMMMMQAIKRMELV